MERVVIFSGRGLSATDAAEKKVVNAEVIEVSKGFELIVGRADDWVPTIVNQWLN